MMEVIDAHQHFWRLGLPGHEWPTPADGVIHRDFLPSDLALAAAGLGPELNLAGGIAVQSQPNDADTDWLLDLADAAGDVLGVVGWADLAAPDAPRRIAALARRPKLKGLRPMLQSIADTEWLLRGDVARGLAAMADHGLRLDALVQPRHLPMLTRFAERWPALPVVIDHAAKPYAARGELDPWRDDIARLAEAGLWCKLSGLRTEQAPGQEADALAPYVDHLIAVFGERLMWGSDWPVLLLAGDGYVTWLADVRRLAARADAATLFAAAARAFYAL